MPLGRALLRASTGIMVVASVACGALIAEEVQPTADGLDGSAPVDGSVFDTTSTADADRLPSSVCSLSPGPKCDLTDCGRRTLHTSQTPTAPHGIVSDASFVYWLEQPGTNDGYNGHARARVLRAEKVGANDASRTIELAKDQEAAVALALDDGWVYWTVYERPDGAQPFARLMRVSAAGGGKPEELATLPPGIRIMRLARVAPGLMFGLSESGHVFRIATQPDVKVTGPIIEKSGLASVVATEQHLFVASVGESKIARMDPAGTSIEPNAFEIPPRNGADKGLSTMWTDCNDIWATRPGTPSLERLSLASGEFSTVISGLQVTVYGMAGDEQYLYIAGANEGVRAVDRKTGALTNVVGGKVFALAVDDEGVYWGEHAIDTLNAGTIFMLVK